MKPLPASVKALARNRPFLATAPVSPWPLRCADGRTFAERAAALKAQAADDIRFGRSDEDHGDQFDGTDMEGSAS